LKATLCGINPRSCGLFSRFGAINSDDNGQIMASRILALLIWAAVAASLAYWGLRWLAQATPVPANATAVSLDNAAKGDLRKLLTGPPPANPTQADPSAASVLAGRIKLLGVVAPRNEGDKGGLALLSVDGKPPRAVRAGHTVDGDMVLLTVSQRGAEIGPAAGPAAVKLDLPLMPMAATGSLPPPTGFSTGGAPATAPQQMPGAVPDINSGMAGTPEGMPQASPDQSGGNNNVNRPPRPVRPGGNRPL
jgi:general secretion pathway protein C